MEKCGMGPLGPLFTVDDLQDFRFSESDLRYLESLGIFPKDFPDQIRDFRFTGD